MICYVTHLWGPLLTLRTYHGPITSQESYHRHAFLVRFTHILFSKSIPNFNAIMPSNRAGPYDHNGTTFNSIPILEAEIRNLPGFLFTHSIWAMLMIQSTYYISLERSLQLEYSTIEILGSCPVVMEIIRN